MKVTIAFVRHSFTFLWNEVEDLRVVCSQTCQDFNRHNQKNLANALAFFHSLRGFSLIFCSILELHVDRFSVTCQRCWSLLRSELLSPRDVATRSQACLVFPLAPLRHLSFLSQTCSRCRSRKKSRHSCHTWLSPLLRLDPRYKLSRNLFTRVFAI